MGKQKIKIDKQDDIIKLMLGYLCVATEPEASLVRKVEILDRFGLSSEDITIICKCPKQSVINAKSQLKKGRTNAKKGKKNKEVSKNP
jgi:hypothetical protein